MPFLIFFLALSIMVFAHELGHFLMAKKHQVKVEEFGLGLPPRLWARKIGETLYSINLIPMGGFVRVWGMEEEVKKEKKRAFYHQPRKTQLLILTAGVVMNFLLAILVFALVYGLTGIPQKIGAVKVVEVKPNSPAAKAGIKEQEIILKIQQEEEIKLKTTAELIAAVKRWAGTSVKLTLVAESCYRANKKKEEIICFQCDCRQLELIPRKNPPSGEGAMGVVIVDSEIVKPPFWQRLPLGVWSGFKEAIFWGKEIVLAVGRALGKLFRGQIPTEVAGPVGIYQASTEIYHQSGLLAMIHFFAVISVNLVVVNLLPLPGTDGWQVILLSIEAWRGKEIKSELKRKMNQIGLGLLLILFFLILLADIRRFWF